MSVKMGGINFSEILWVGLTHKGLCKQGLAG